MRVVVRMWWAVAAIVILCGGASSTYAQASDPKVKEALRLIDLGNTRDAVAQMQQYVAQNPKSAEAHAGYAMALLSVNNVAQAATEAQSAFDIDRKDILARVARSFVYGRQGHPEDAVKEMNQAVKLNDKEIGSYLALSRLYLSLDSLHAAEVTLYRAQQINDKDVRSYLGLADLYERQRIPDLAIGQYEQARKLDPNDITVMARLASMYHRARRYNESANEWLKVLHVDSTYADAYYQIGNLYFLGGQYQNAAAYANRYVQLRPEDVYGQWLLARSLTEIGQYQQALPALEKVSSNDSLKALSQLLLARGYFYSKDYPKAIEIFRAAKSMEPQDFATYGSALFLSGDTTGAIEQLRRSLVNDTVRTPQKKLETQLTIAQLLYNQKQYEQAAQEFADIAKANPSVDWYLSAGQTYAAAKKPELANEYYQKALAVDPTSIKVLWTMAIGESNNLASDDALNAWQKVADAAKQKGLTDTVGIALGYEGYHFAAKKEWAKAVDVLEKSLQSLEASKNPNLENFTLLLGQSYHQLQQIDKAKECYQKTLKLNPANKGAKEGMEYINKAASSKKGK